MVSLRYLMIICLLGPLHAAAETAVAEPEVWYESGYAPLWTGKPGDQVEALLMYYADTVVTHGADGSLTTTPKRRWLVEPMEEWLAEGWIDSSLEILKTERINATTTSFRARWVDRYTDAPDDFSCGWYLADWIDGRWQFTAYADLDCAYLGQ